MKFTAFDFETATSDRASICQVGFAHFEDGKLTGQESYLIQPPYNEYDFWNVRIHGIRPEDTENVPSLSEIWPTLKPLFSGKNLIAHNAGFDVSVLRNALDSKGIEYPSANYTCSMQLSRVAFPELPRHRLNEVAEHLGIEFKHHDAEQDSVACGTIACHALLLKDVSEWDEIGKAFGLSTGRIFPGGYDPSLVKSAAWWSTGDRYKNVAPDPTLLNMDSPLYGKAILISGQFQNMARDEANYTVRSVGAICKSGISKKVDYLVLGEDKYELFISKDSSAFTSKVRKALELQEAGHHIQIIPESLFQQLAGF